LATKERKVWPLKCPSHAHLIYGEELEKSVEIGQECAKRAKIGQHFTLSFDLINGACPILLMDELISVICLKLRAC
jgi:hypothetical protein